MRKFEYGHCRETKRGGAGEQLRRVVLGLLAGGFALGLFPASPAFPVSSAFAADGAGRKIIRDGDFASELDFFLEETSPDRQAGRSLTFTSPLEAYRQGKTAFDEGWYELALPALSFAASHGVLGAQLKLATMYERGLGVAVDDARAFELYSRIARNNWNISTYHPAAPLIGNALTSLGRYYLNGIEAVGLRPDARRAAVHFSHAAQYFGNARAQYELARLYLEGRGVKKNIRRAIAWLKNSSRKRYAPSQALLGQILWEGELVPRRRLKALVLLTMAQKNAAPQDAKWIGGIYKSIFDQSDQATRRKAKTAVARWVRIYDPARRRQAYAGAGAIAGHGRGGGRVIIRKEVRIGIAEDGSRVIESRQTITRQGAAQGSGRALPMGRKSAGGVSALSVRSLGRVRKRRLEKGMSREEREWMGMSGTDANTGG